MLSFFRKNAGRIIIITVIFFGASVFIASLPSFLGKGRSPEQPTNSLAQIDGEEIDFQIFLRNYRETQALAGIGRYEEDKPSIWMDLNIQFQALNQAIDKQVLLKAAHQEKVKVSGRDLKNQLEQMAKQYNFKDIKALKKAVEDSGQKWKDLERSVKQDLMIYKAQQKISNSVTVTEQTLNNLYKKVTARHILLLTTGGQKEAKQAYDQIQALKKQLKKDPKKFAELAKQYSQDPGSKDQGGLLPEFGYGEMVPEFQELAFALAPGELGGPVKTSYGYHLILVESVKDPGIPLEIDVKQLKQQTEQQLKQQKLSQWYQKVRSEARVSINHPLMQSMQSLQQGQTEKALLGFLRIQSQFPGVQGHVLIGHVYSILGRTAEAQKEFQKAALLEEKVSKQSYPYLHFYRGQAYVKAGQKTLAYQEWRRAEKNANRNLVLLSALEQTYRQNQWIQDANRVKQLIEQTQSERQALINSENVINSLATPNAENP